MDTLPLSYIELSENNLKHNIATLRGFAKPGTRFALAVKGNAYGHGLAEIVRMADADADSFLVFTIDELRVVRAVSAKPVLVIGYVQPSALGEAVALGCTFSVSTLEQLAAVNNAAEERGLVQDVHIACDAFLGREGFLEADLPELFRTAKSLANIRVTGTYAHFANIEDTTDFTHAQKQIDAYARMQKIAIDAGYTNLETHISATSGLLTYEKNEGHHPTVRIGIGMYGMWPNETMKRKYTKAGIELRPVLSWKTHIAQVKTLPAGETIGYGLTYKTQKETRIALVPQGYADGFVRALSNCGMVLIGGRRCAVLGRVSMNMFVADVTNVPDAVEGDEVVLIGEQGDKSISAQEVAERSETINYEVTTRISPLLPRILRY
jgi:alanine racemase